MAIDFVEAFLKAQAQNRELCTRLLELERRCFTAESFLQSLMIVSEDGTLTQIKKHCAFLRQRQTAGQAGSDRTSENHTSGEPPCAS